MRRLEDPAGDRCGDLGEVEIELLRVQSRLRLLDRGGGRPLLAQAFVEGGSRYGGCSRQSLCAIQLARRGFQTGVGAVEVGLRAIDRRLIWPRVDDEEHIAGLHHGAVGEVHHLEIAGDSGAHVDRCGRLETPGELVILGETLMQRRCHRDWRWRRRRLLFAT